MRSIEPMIETDSPTVKRTSRCASGRPIVFSLAVAVAVLLVLPGCATRGSGAGAKVPKAATAPVPGSLEAAALPCPEPALPEPAPPSQTLRDAMAAYDAGQYGRAMPLFEALDTDDSADGATLYRLAYCYSTIPDPQKSQSTYDRARSVLEAKVATPGATLEEHFYLVNALLTLERDQDARAAAEKAVAAVESCRLPVLPGALSHFRLGKLYGDAGRIDRQVSWYRRALAGFDTDPAAPRAYVNRARLTVLGFDVEQGNWAAVIPSLQRERAQNPRSTEAAGLLFAAQIRSGDLEAALATVESIRKGGGDLGDSAVYLEGIVTTVKRMASAGHSLPAREPDDRSPMSLTREELIGTPEKDGLRGGRFQEAAQVGRQLISAEAEDGSYRIEERGPKKIPVKLPGEALLRRIDDAQGRFISLCLEAFRRGMPLQELTFRTGAQQLLVHDWRQLWVQAHRPDMKRPPVPRQGAQPEGENIPPGKEAAPPPE